MVLRTRVAVVVAVVVLAAVAGTLPGVPEAAAVSSSLRRYPYLTDLVTTTVTVNWATTTSVTTGRVAYGRVGSGSCTAHSSSATRVSITVGSTVEYQWKARLSGLSTNTAYCYRIYGGATDLLGSDPSPIFRSQIPAGSSTPYSFAVFGDWGSVDSDGDNDDQARLMSQIAASGVRFAVTTGDTAYPGGSDTNYGDLVQEGAATSTIFGPSFWTVAGDSIPLFNTQGNHGLRSAALTTWPQDRAVSTSGGRYQMDTYCCANDTEARNYPSQWYAFDAGEARFYVLSTWWDNNNVGDSNLYDNDYDAHWTASKAEYTWLANDLARHPTAMKFAFFHFPLYADSTYEGSDPMLSGPTKLEGLLGRNGVDIVFNGHAHIYQRNRASAAGMPVSYVTGGGGVSPTPVTGCDSIDQYAIGWSSSASTHGSACGAAPRPTTIDRLFHFLLVSVNGNEVTVTPTDEYGRVFDVQTYIVEGLPKTRLAFAAADDSYVKKGVPHGNYGAAPSLAVDGDPVKHTLLKFNVAGVGSREVLGAWLRLYCERGSKRGGVVRSTTASSWSEATVTWRNAPGAQSRPKRAIGRADARSWVRVPVTRFVTGDGTVSFRVRLPLRHGVRYASRDGDPDTAPRLIVSVG